MDKSWINKSRNSGEYIHGVQNFLEMAFGKISAEATVLCPCGVCQNRFWHDMDKIRDHLFSNGFLSTYDYWIYHGETITGKKYESDENIFRMLHEACGVPRSVEKTDPELHCELDEETEVGLDEPNMEYEKFASLLEDAKEELYPNCKEFSKLSFIVHLFHLKCLSGWSNTSFTKLLCLIKRALPEGETLPETFYQTKKMISNLGLGYVKIDACPNNCILYYKENSELESCPKCHESRWKSFGEDNENNNPTPSNPTPSNPTPSNKTPLNLIPLKRKSKPIPAKVLRHFPLKPRLQRLYMSSETASFMRWHEEGRIKDGVMRHPADSPAWKTLDHEFPVFGSELRNVRLGLASDGFNPYNTFTTQHSIWPVILIPYNLPPWLCMKQPYFILSLLIPGPYSPGNNIDVFLQPLIDELKELWDYGVQTYDVSREENFCLRASLLWTISDFPGYAMLSGYSTKGYLACPCCDQRTHSQYLKHGRKICYMGHRQFLNRDHKFRRDKSSFDGTREIRDPPRRLSGSEVLLQVQALCNNFGKKNDKKEKKLLAHNWKKKSVFFQLPYWKNLLLRHNLDVMHIEKNFCDNVTSTLLNIPKKTKDNYKSRRDLEEMGIRSPLHLEEVGGKCFAPPACYSLSKEHKDTFFRVLKGIKVPDGYAGNIRRYIDQHDRKISGLKSHDYHILMQQLLPIATRQILPKKVCSQLIDLGNFFRELCSKSIRADEIRELESKIPLILCNLERILPPSFFDVMVHLPVHLPEEARIAGLVQYRWMYPIERYLQTLKKYVRNRSQPEGSIAEGYLANESLNFCSHYLKSVDTKLNRPNRNDDNQSNEVALKIFLQNGRGISDPEQVQLDAISLAQAHRYVLFNCDDITPYMKLHYDLIKRKHRRSKQKEIEKIHSDTFPNWFRDHILQLSLDEDIPKELLYLALGPLKAVGRYKGYITNGFRFHTKTCERKRTTQNSGVAVTARTRSFASAKDSNPVTGDVTYCGVLQDIVELNYYGEFNVRLFKCDWANVRAKGNGVKTDALGFTLVNFKNTISTGKQACDEPFILASQAEQVFYVRDPVDSNWSVVVRNKPRDAFDLKDSCIDDLEFSIGEGVRETYMDDDNVAWTRDDMDMIPMEKDDDDVLKEDLGIGDE